MASIERIDKARKRTRSLNVRISSSKTSIKKIPNLSTSDAFEVQRIIMHDGFGYFFTS
jgi:hypothetical protein